MKLLSKVYYKKRNCWIKRYWYPTLLLIIAKFFSRAIIPVSPSTVGELTWYCENFTSAGFKIVPSCVLTPFFFFS